VWRAFFEVLFSVAQVVTKDLTSAFAANRQTAKHHRHPSPCQCSDWSSSQSLTPAEYIGGGADESGVCLEGGVKQIKQVLCH